MSGSPSSYDAFISYSSALDGALAATLQHWLERFATPWYRPRSLRIFRDFTSLSAAPDLQRALESALSRSSWFILLASPEAARSRWVDRELAWWRANRSSDRVCIVLCSGHVRWSEEKSDWDPDGTDALPPSVYGMFSAEPLWVDLSSIRTANVLDRSNPVALNGVAQVAAPLRGVDKDHLVGEHIRLYRRAKRQLIGGVIALAVLALLASAATVVALQQRATALAQRDLALSNSLRAQADQVRSEDVSLAAQLHAQAYRIDPTPEAYSRVIDTQVMALSVPLTGHTGSVDTLAFDSTASLLATGSADDTVRLWDLTRPGRPTLLGSPLEDSVRAAISPDDTVLATGSVDGDVRLRSMDGSVPGDTIGTLTGFEPLVFSPDGDLLSTGDADGLLQLWSVADPQRPAPVGPPFSQSVRVARFSPDGRILATGGFDGAVRLWDVADPARPTEFGPLPEPAENWVLSAAFSADGRILATSSTGPSVRLWDVTDPSIPTPLGEPMDGFWAVALSPDGHTMAVGGERSAALYNIALPARPRLLVDGLTGHASALYAMEFSSDGRFLATGSLDHTARLWRIPPAFLTGHTEQIAVAAFSPDGRLLATGSADHTVRLWDMAAGQKPAAAVGEPLAGHTDAVSTVAFSPDGRLLATGSADATIRLWDVADPQHPEPLGEPLTGHTEFVATVAFSPDGDTLASGGFDATLLLWDVSDPSHPAGPLVGTTTEVSAVAFSPDGRIMASGSTDQRVRLWDMSDPSLPVLFGEPLGGHEPVSALDSEFRLAFSPDGRLLVTGGGDRTVRVWDIADPADPAPLGEPLTGHSRSIAAVAVSADGRTLATAGGGVRLFDFTDPSRPVPLGEPLTGNARGVFTVALSPDGRTLAAGGDDFAVRLWDLDAADAIDGVCAATGDAAVRAQWDQHAPGVEYESVCR